MKYPTLLAACGCAVLVTSFAPNTLAAERPLWELGVGVGALRLPHYRGSDQSHNFLLPVPYLVYRGDIFKADKDGTRAVLLNTDALDFDISVAISAPTRSRDNDARRGMADLAPTFELGPNLNWTVARAGDWKLDLRLPVRGVATLESNPKMVGWTSTPNANLDVANVGGWNLGLLAGPVINSRRMNGHFYDVAASEAIAGRPAYSAAGGYAGAQFVAALSRRYERSWAGFFFKFDTLHGAQFDASPLVRRRNNIAFGFAMSWVLKTSDQMVTVPD
jgi:outer membrane scaffolding protein for murein synthesis (MipA/OmpV family)